MTQTEHIPFVLGGQILDKRYPNVLRPHPNASARRNRTLSHKDWDEFCNEFEMAMSWSYNWPLCVFHPAVLVTFVLFLGSVVLLVVTREVQEVEEKEKHKYEDSNHTALPVHDYKGNTLLTIEILPDICVLLLLVLSITMAISMIQMFFSLQEGVAAVCEEYTQRYQDYCGITFSVQKNPALASPPWRSHSSHPSAVRHTRLNRDYRSCLVITKDSEEATSRYQNWSPRTLQRQQQQVLSKFAPEQIHFNKHPQHPNDEMGEPPFFDVHKIPMLLPPQDHNNNHNKSKPTPNNGTER